MIGERYYTSGGRNPFHVPNAEITAADIVNFDYVINDIKNGKGKVLRCAATDQ